MMWYYKTLRIAREIWFRLKMLWYLRSYKNWLKELKELDQHICCDGRECGCYGATHREEWEYYIMRKAGE